MFEFIDTIKENIKIKEHLKELLYNSKTKEDLLETQKIINKEIDRTNLSADDKLNIKSDVQSEIDRKSFQMGFENLFK